MGSDGPKVQDGYGFCADCAKTEKPKPKPEKRICPNCDADLDEVYHARSVRLKWDGIEWLENDVFSDEYACAKCHHVLDDEDIGAAGLRE